jgi:CelD/BcsL family acetyltransferase involved in cellulose biosynthesis
MRRTAVRLLEDVARGLAVPRRGLLPDHAGFRNPLRTLPHVTSPNVSLAADLKGGFARLVSEASGKRKLKKHRTQARKYEAGRLRAN